MMSDGTYYMTKMECKACGEHLVASKNFIWCVNRECKKYRLLTTLRR